MVARSAGNHSRSRVLFQGSFVEAVTRTGGGRVGGGARQAKVLDPPHQNPPAPPLPPVFCDETAKGNGISCSTVTKHQLNRVFVVIFYRGRVAALCKMVCGGQVVSSGAEVEDAPPTPSVMSHLVKLPLRVSRGFFFSSLDLSRP